MIDKILIRGAREHNLKNIDIDIPKNKLVVFTGVSGSGKSSLAFDTIYAEGQRRYVESLSSYARQFLGIMSKPDVDQIVGLSPAISIDQKTTSHNPRSTVGTITEIYDYLRLLYARVGHPHCYNCGREIAHLSLDQIVDQVLEITNNILDKQKRIMILAPLVKGRKGEYTQLFNSLRAKGITRVRVDRQIYGVDEDYMLIKTNKHSIEAVVDRLTSLDKARLRLSIEQALKLANGELIVSIIKDPSLEFPDHPKNMEDHLFSERFACPVCNISMGEIEPRIFSFNSPFGACPTCTGLGFLLKIDPTLIVNPELTIMEGGILPLGGEIDHETYFFKQIKEFCIKNQINLICPIDQIEKTKLDQVLKQVSSRLERLYFETKSDWRRADIGKYMRSLECTTCHGTRLKPEALAVTINKKNIYEVTQISIRQTLEWVEGLQLSPRERSIATPICKELASRLKFLTDVGLDYLTLGRSAGTLAGGEAQRIRLASQIGSGLSGVLYVLDEPSIGLHQRDNQRLIDTLTHLRDLGNSVVVVEHDREMMEKSDYIFDFGPGAGIHGGKLIAEGTVEKLKKDKNSITGQYLSGKKQIILQELPLPKQGELLKIVGAKEHNLKNIDVEFPLGKMVLITGVSGSGKSTLIHDVLYQALAKNLNPMHKESGGKYDQLLGLEYVDKVVLIDQSPIGKTPRSNPATYTGSFTIIRELFAMTRDARIKGYNPGRFSFNVRGGRCEACEGEGQIKIEMQFLPDVYVDCEVCKGKRYNEEALEVLYKDKNIADILDLTVENALDLFAGLPTLRNKLETLKEVGLNYIKLGQPAPTLSGGEAQRVKLATELSKKATGKTVYILDEPTTGLHFADLEKLLYVLKKLVAMGNTVIIIEHNLDVIKNADWIIDLGPEGGDRGGEIVAVGTVEDIKKSTSSWTGKYL